MTAGVASADLPSTETPPPAFLELARTPAARAADDLPRRVVRESFCIGRASEGAARLTNFVAEAFRAPGGVSDPQLISRLARAADGAVLLTVGDTRPVRTSTGEISMESLRIRLRDDVAAWLFATDERLALLADTLSPRDDARAVWEILTLLHDHDPDGRDDYFELMLALAVVWDRPRPPMHGQMGKNRLPLEPQVAARYDYFKELYASGASKVSYRRLNVDTLVFVVDTPVPVAELQWARQNVKGAANAWGKKFHEIRYDRQRAEQGVFQWPHGQYTLAGIEKHGGICVDQAYFAVMTARAWGIPAIFFVGPGRRGGHAWFGYLKGEDRWEMDIGRYEMDQYQTGFAINPQTGEPMSDHELAYQCDRALRRPAFARAQQLTRIAEILLAAGDAPNAVRCARQARGEVPLHARPWELEAAALLRLGDTNGCLELWNRQAEVFGRFPDVQTAVRERQAALLRQIGREDEASRLLANHVRRMGSRREDLARGVVAREAQRSAVAGEAAAARERLEKMLRDQRREGAKVLPLLQQYIEISHQSGEAQEAARFVENYIARLRREYGESPQNEMIFRELLRQAYENAGDERKLEALRRDAERAARRR